MHEGYGCFSSISGANSPELLIRLARAGVGIVVVPDYFALPDVRRGELRRVLPTWCLPSATVWAVFPGRKLMPAKTRGVIDMLQVALGVLCRRYVSAQHQSPLCLCNWRRVRPHGPGFGTRHSARRACRCATGKQPTRCVGGGSVPPLRIAGQNIEPAGVWREIRYRQLG
ncbi:MAG TPA: LysR substrate-binding domain-containing protein [Rhodoferax sp.]